MPLVLFVLVVPRPAFYPRRWGFFEVNSVNLNHGRLQSGQKSTRVTTPPSR